MLRPREVVVRLERLGFHLARQEHLWILVDNRGGRLTAGYDSTAVPADQLPLYGSYGPFIPRRRAPPPGGASNATSTNHASVLSGASITGYLKYANFDLAGAPLTAVAGAEIEAFCHGKSDPLLDDYDLQYYVSTLTSSDGSFGVGCDVGYEYITGNILLRNAHIHAMGKNGAYAGAGFAGYDGEHFDLRVANDYAARVFLDLRAFVPAIFTKFGRSRSRMTAQVADNDPAFGIVYCPTTQYANCSTNDYIKSNYTRVFSGSAGQMHWDGLFVSVHEYAHGYQHNAVEPWAWGSNACTEPGGHGWTETENIGCAIVEAFADWISMTIIGQTITTSPYGGDYGLENNRDAYPSGAATNPPIGGDGVRVESAVAAFLYDLIDNGAEADSPTNTAGPAESHDSISVAPGWILDVMQFCRLDGAALNLSGADQLVYCLEGSTGAYSIATAYSGSWRSYSTVTYEQTLPTYSQSLIRKLWKYNMYGVP